MRIFVRDLPFPSRFGSRQYLSVSFRSRLVSDLSACMLRTIHSHIMCTGEKYGRYIKGVELTMIWSLLKPKMCCHQALLAFRSGPADEPTKVGIEDVEFALRVNSL